MYIYTCISSICYIYVRIECNVYYIYIYMSYVGGALLCIDRDRDDMSEEMPYRTWCGASWGGRGESALTTANGAMFSAVGGVGAADGGRTTTAAEHQSQPTATLLSKHEVYIT